MRVVYPTPYYYVCRAAGGRSDHGDPPGFPWPRYHVETGNDVQFEEGRQAGRQAGRAQRETLRRDGPLLYREPIQDGTWSHRSQSRSCRAVILHSFLQSPVVLGRAEPRRGPQPLRPLPASERDDWPEARGGSCEWTLSMEFSTRFHGDQGGPTRQGRATMEQPGDPLDCYATGT